MAILCGPTNSKIGRVCKGDLRFVLYDFPKEKSSQGSAGATLLKKVQGAKLAPVARAWDLLSLALSVICADTAKQRKESSDGWTRQIQLKIAVHDPDFWNGQKDLIEHQLKFLTTDIWSLEFVGCGLLPKPPKDLVLPKENCVAMLSGGLDSLIGTLDLVAGGKKPYSVSQVSVGDKRLQSCLAREIGGGLRHLQLNHNVKYPGKNDRSQRSRSLIFLAYGVLVASALKLYEDGGRIKLYMCENGWISINPPLTPARLGSLSTRTTHPIFLRLFQDLLDAAELRITVYNPYQFKTKGEMLGECKDQVFLAKYAEKTTSCGRYARNGWKQCGRCLPCLVRRAAFHAWNGSDRTSYVCNDLSKNDAHPARFDDVRCAAMATALVDAQGLDALATTNLNALVMGDLKPYKDILSRGFKEISQFLEAAGIQ